MRAAHHTKRLPPLVTAAALAAVAAALCGCTEAYYGHTWPDEPEKTAAPSPAVEKPCTVVHNKDGTTDTSC